MTTTGVLLRKAEIKETVGNMRNCTARMPPACFPCGNKRRSISSNRPERRTPSLTKKSMATVIMPLLENPSKSSFGVRMPAHRKTTAPDRRTNPGRMWSFTKARMTKAKTIRTKITWNVMQK